MKNLQGGGWGGVVHNVTISMNTAALRSHFRFLRIYRIRHRCECVTQVPTKARKDVLVNTSN